MFAALLSRCSNIVITPRKNRKRRNLERTAPDVRNENAAASPPVSKARSRGNHPPLAIPRKRCNSQLNPRGPRKDLLILYRVRFPKRQLSFNVHAPGRQKVRKSGKSLFQKVRKSGNLAKQKVRKSGGDMKFKRKIYNELVEWKTHSNGSNALLVEGARRIGKSTVAEEFARNEYRSYILIDFSEASSGVRALFDDVSDLNYLFLQLQLQYSVKLFERESLIIFDEVQLCPHARQAIKSLVKDGRYDYLETGSLISIRKNTATILIPSEERKIQMRPMDYEEFRWACGDQATIPLLASAFESRLPLGEKTNRKLMRDFRLYMLVGGMPQAVDTYLQTNNLLEVDAVKRGIIDLYEEDFYKIDPTGALSMLFDAIPAQLSKKSSRYQVSSVLANRQASDILEEIAELRESKTVLVAHHANDPNIGVASSIDLEKFKLYLADTGLFVSLAFKDANFTENIVYEKLLADKLPTNLGAVYENIVAQELAAHGKNLFYHTWPIEGAKRNYEIDFLTTDGKKICPIEVKSSSYKTHASLDAFGNKFSSRIGKRYLVYTKDLQKDGNVACVPTYMSCFL